MIKKATHHHVSAIRAVFRACIMQMKSQGIVQWDDDYPAQKDIDTDIERGELYYIGEGENVWAVFTINEIQNTQYQDIAWNCTEGKILVVHRLAVHPVHQGKGLAQQLMRYAEEYADQHDYAAIRLDSYEGNPRSLDFYRKMGYTQTGYVQFDYQPMRCFAFEKAVEIKPKS